MKLTVKNALFLAGGLLLGSALIAQFTHQRLIVASLLVAIAPWLVYRAYAKDPKKLKACLRKGSQSAPKLRIGATLLCLGFAVATTKLIYLWMHI